MNQRSRAEIKRGAGGRMSPSQRLSTALNVTNFQHLPSSTVSSLSSSSKFSPVSDPLEITELKIVHKVAIPLLKQKLSPLNKAQMLNPGSSSFLLLFL